MAHEKADSAFEAHWHTIFQVNIANKKIDQQFMDFCSMSNKKPPKAQWKLLPSLQICRYNYKLSTIYKWYQ